jgi:hypothetical protein
MSNIRPTGYFTGMNYAESSTAQPDSRVSTLPVSETQRGRRLAIGALVSADSNSIVFPVPVPGSAHTAAMLRGQVAGTPPGSSHEAVQEAQESQQKAAPIDKGKGRAVTPLNMPSRSPSPQPGQKHARSSASPTMEAPAEKRINTGTAVLPEQDAAAPGAAASGKPHYYEQIQPRPGVAALLAQGKSLTYIMENIDHTLDSKLKKFIIDFSNFIKSKGLRRTEAFKNFYYFNKLMHEHQANNADAAPGNALSVLRKLRSAAFPLPSQEKLTELKSRHGTLVSQMTNVKQKSLTDAAGRLDELMTGLELSESPYQEPGAQQRFIGLKHQIAAMQLDQEWQRDIQLFEVMYLLRRDLYPLPLDHALITATQTVVDGYSESKRKNTAGTVFRLAGLLSEIAHLTDISTEDFIEVLKNWKDMRETVPKELGTQDRDFNASAVFSQKQRNIFKIISDSLSRLGYTDSTRTLEMVLSISNALRAASDQAQRNVPGPAQTS